MSNGNFVRDWQHTRTTSFLLAMANPNSNQTFALSCVISARQISELRIPDSICSIGIDAAGSRSTLYGSRSAATIAGAKISSYRLSEGPFSNGWITEQVDIEAFP